MDAAGIDIRPIRDEAVPHSTAQYRIGRVEHDLNLSKRALAFRSYLQEHHNDDSIDRIVVQHEVGDHWGKLLLEEVGFRCEGVALSGALDSRGNSVDGWTMAMRLRTLYEPRHSTTEQRWAQARFFAEGDGFHRDIQGSQFHLRRYIKGDLTRMMLASNDSISRRYQSDSDPNALEDKDSIESFIKYSEQQWERGRAVAIAVANEDNAYAGSIQIMFDQDGIGEFGAMMSPDQRGTRGSGNLAHGIIRIAFEELKLTALTAVTDHDNRAAIFMLRALGFEDVGYTTIPDRYSRRIDAKVQRRFELRNIVNEQRQCCVDYR